MLWHRAWRVRGARPHPLVADQSKRHDEADARRRDIGLLRDALHLEAYEVVREADRPQLLGYAGGRLAANGFLPFEHLGLHFVVAELEFPTLVVQRNKLARGIPLRIEQRREQRLGRETLALVRDRTPDHRVGERRVRF